MSKIKNNLSVKIFLGIALILLAVSFLMFGMLRIFMPKTYENELFSQVTANTKTFAKQLENSPQNDWESMLIQFCLANNIGATIFDKNGSQIANANVFVYTEKDGAVTQNENKTSTSYNRAFENDGKIYTITAYANAESV
ncbi:MAG: hypothetical protein LBM93_05510, partial [Oscillospiraceae bacterium]|nr:hypothetical protein [Oscillospiraceae bacterium]